jgi:hypothetical protein
MAWTEVKGLSLEDAASLIGATVRWRTPHPRRVSPGEFSDVREGVIVWALPYGHWPISCPDVQRAKSSQCQFSLYGGMVSDRAIVRVARTHSKSGAPLPPHYYAPRLSAIIAVLRNEHGS